jgi:hypothetical protein
MVIRTENSTRREGRENLGTTLIVDHTLLKKKNVLETASSSIAQSDSVHRDLSMG